MTTAYRCTGCLESSPCYAIVCTEQHELRPDVCIFHTTRSLDESNWTRVDWSELPKEES